MALKHSSALLVAMFAIASPALAQDTAAPTTGTAPAEQPAVPNALPENMDAAANDAAAAVQSAAGADAAATPDAAPVAPTTDAAAATSDSAPADTDAATTTDAAAGAAPAAAPVADAAEPAETVEPQPGSYYVKATHDDWTLRCIRTEANNDPCELYQLLQDASGNAVAEVTMIPLSGGEVALGATVVAPLETDLGFGLHMKVDTGPENVYPFNFCAPVGCVARMGFTEAELSGLKRGSASTVKLLPFGGPADQPVEVAMSLSGFTAAFTELESVVAEMRAAADATPAADAAPAPDAPATEAPAN